MKHMDKEGLEGMMWNGENTTGSNPDFGLIASIGKMALCLTPKRRHVFAMHDNLIRSFCVHEGKLFYAAGGSIYDALEEEEIQVRDGTVFALESFDNKLYDATTCSMEDNGKKYTIHGIFETGRNWLAAYRNKDIYSLKSYNGSLWDAGNYPEINSNFGKGSYQIDSPQAMSLEKHMGKLYYSSGSDIWEVGQKSPIAKRTAKVFCMASHDDKILDSGEYCNIYDTLLDKFSHDSLYKFNQEVLAIKSVPMLLWEKLVEKSEKYKDKRK